jgi:uncharacterized protein YraI
MKNRKIIALIAVVLFLVQVACSTGDILPQALAPTQDVNSLVATNVALTQAAQIVIVPTNTNSPFIVPPTTGPLFPATNTTAPIILPTNTSAPLGLVTGVVNYGANCRTGPGANFPIVVVLPEQTKVDIMGKAKATDKSQWWLVRHTGNSDCWLIDAAVAITGDTNTVPEVPSPATPTPVPPPSWAGTWTYWMRGGFGGTTDESGPLTLIQSGNSLSSLPFFVYNGTFRLNGTISADGMSFNGTVSIEREGYSYALPVVFKRNPSNLNQFRGSWYNSGSGGASWDGDWCGAINGASKPSPCKSN